MTLIDRLSKLEGPDREVDAEIEAVFVGGRIHYNDPANKEAVIERPIDGLWIRGIYPYRKISRYTASVDAAIALAERVQSYSIMVLFNDAFIWLHARYPSEKHSKMLPIAFLIALLRAKEANHDQAI